MQNADVKDGSQATTPFSYFPCTEFLPVRPHCVNATLVLCGWRLSSRTWNL